jgi:dTDP-4-dehydrorhamnose reductase
MLGHDLVRVLSPASTTGLSSKDLDVTDLQAVGRTFRRHAPQVVIHAAAYTDVDACESHAELAHRVNGLGTRNVAQIAEDIGAAVVYISTDYVFDGEKTEPYLESDPTHPINVYGESKLAGEGFVRDLCGRHYIIRTSWLFGRHGKNFVATILRLTGEQKTLRVVSDQVGSPTYSYHLAQKIAELVSSNRFGTYHVTNSSSCSWFEFALQIMKMRQICMSVVPITSAESGRPARRPRNSVLRNLALEEEGLQLLPHWQEGLAQYLAELS